jgi:hypothetical protein
MKIEKFVAGLAPSMRKDQILGDIANVRKELNESTLPAYEAISTLFSHWKWRSEEMKSMSSTFSRLAGGGNMVESLLKGLKEVSAALDTAEDYIMKTYNEEMAVSALTYKKAGVLQFVEAIAYVTKFSRKLANYMLVCETAVLDDSDTVINEAFTPFERGYLEGGFMTFCQAFKAIAIPVAAVKARIEEAPEVIVKAAAAGIMHETLGEKKTDSFGLNLIAAKWNPFYHIGKAIAEWQVSSYNASKEELQLVQMRKLLLEKLAAKKPDAALSQEINYNEGRVQNLNAKIAKMEASYA